MNHLRNLALDQAGTDHVLICDVDLLPARFAYDAIVTAVNESAPLTQKALVVPAFAVHSTRVNTTSMPSDKTQLINLLDSSVITPFLADRWPKGHRPTDYNRWRTADAVYSVGWQTDYEPYVVVDRRTVPRFDQRFAGYGWNKVAHAMLLDSLGYDFLVLPNAWVVHLPHWPSVDMAHFSRDKLYRYCTAVFKAEFVKELVREQRMTRPLVEAPTN